MPLKLTAGISRKVGLPHYSSVAASCHLELELDAGLWQADPELLDVQVRRAYTVCQRAVQEELARQQAAATEPGDRMASAIAQESRSATRGNRQSPRPQKSAGSNGEAQGPASVRQRGFLRALAGQIPGLSAKRLDELSQALCGKPLAELSSREAAELIDALQDVKTGKADLEVLFQRATA